MRSGEADLGPMEFGASGYQANKIIRLPILLVDGRNERSFCAGV